MVAPAYASGSVAGRQSLLAPVSPEVTFVGVVPPSEEQGLPVERAFKLRNYQAFGSGSVCNFPTIPLSGQRSEVPRGRDWFAVLI